MNKSMKSKSEGKGVMVAGVIDHVNGILSLTRKEVQDINIIPQPATGRARCNTSWSTRGPSMPSSSSTTARAGRGLDG
jgi:hypothetical protein